MLSIMLRNAMAEMGHIDGGFAPFSLTVGGPRSLRQLT